MGKILYKARKEKVIETCAGCPKVIGGWSGQSCGCRLDKKERPIDEYIFSRPMPDWCPLPAKIAEE